MAEAKHTESRESLMRSAARIFSRKGYAATSVREIVKQANVTTPVLYYHFHSKEGLFLAVLEEAEKDFLEQLKGSLVGETLRERIVSVIGIYFDVVNEKTDLVRIAYQALFGPEGSHPEFHWDHFLSRERELLAEVFRDGHSRGPLARNVSLDDAVFYLQSVIVLTTIRKTIGEVTNLDKKYAETLADNILEGLSPRNAEDKVETGA